MGYITLDLRKTGILGTKQTGQVGIAVTLYINIGTAFESTPGQDTGYPDWYFS
jgi:hypothetical protein